MHKIGQSGEFLDKLLGALIKTGLPLIGNVLEPLAKSILVPLGLTAAAWWNYSEKKCLNLALQHS